MRVALEYARLPHCDQKQLPHSVVVKFSSRKLAAGGGGRAAWMADQDTRESRFYRQSRDKIKAPRVFYSQTDILTRHEGDVGAQSSSVRVFRCCTVMDDLTASHVSGEDVAMLLYG